MNRRSFLKRTAVVATATYAGLRWTAPPPPEGGFLVPRYEIIGHEPTWWAECLIDGKRHRAMSFALSTPIDYAEDAEAGDASMLFRSLPSENIVTAKLWAEESRRKQILELFTERRIAEISLTPDKWIPKTGEVFGGLDFQGFVTQAGPFPGVSEESWIPYINVEFKVTGPLWMVTKQLPDEDGFSKHGSSARARAL